MKIRNVVESAAAFGCLALLIPMRAEAHHVMDNQIPGTALEGLVSGLAHPIIGLDHFLFVLALGIACYYFGQKAGMIMVFLAGTISGTVIHLYEATLDYPDAWVAGSLILLGILFFRRNRLVNNQAALIIAAACGIAHGYAYGESIVGAEPTPLIAYLAGFTLVQLLIVFSGYAIARNIDAKKPFFRILRILGGGLTVAGMVFLYRSVT